MSSEPAASGPVRAWDPSEPLMRITTETTKANQALRDYALMGPGRSLVKLKERYQSDYEAGLTFPSKRLATLAGWSSRFHWVDRVADYELLLAEEERAEWEVRRRQVRDFDWGLGGDLRQRVLEFLDRLPDFVERRESEVVDPESGETVRVITLALNTSLVQLAQAGRIASELQRLAASEPTDILELSNLTGAALDRVIERALAELADERQA